MGTVYYLLFPNGKGYVGQTRKPLAYRIRAHAAAVARGNGYCRLLYHAWKKHGPPEVLVISDAIPDDCLNDVEISMISMLGTVSPGGYNLENGGNAKSTHPETRAILSSKMAAAYRNNPEYRAHMDRLARINHTPERRAKLSKALKGRPKPVGFGEIVRKRVTGYKFTAQSRAKMSASAKARGNNNPGQKQHPSRILARERGEKYFFTGEPCMRGHLEKRYVTGGQCAECSRIYLERKRRKRGAPIKGRYSKAPPTVALASPETTPLVAVSTQTPA